MANLKVRYLIVVLLLALISIVVQGLNYEYTPDDESGLADLQSVPMKVGQWWQGEDFPIEEMVYEILETRAIIHRSYTGENHKNVFLSVVHYADTKVDFHAPEACLGGRGFKTEKTGKTITFLSGDKKITLDVAEIVTSRDIGKSLTYYFYKSGEFVGSNYIKMRLSVAANKLFSNDARGSLIRISTKVTPGNEVAAESLLTGFLQDFFPYFQTL